MEFMAMAGRNATQIMAELPSVLDLSAAANTEVARTADIMTNVMGAFNIQSKDATKTADIFARATSSANVDMEMLAETMKDAAPIADVIGASLTDVATLAGFLGNVGIQGTKAGTALKNIFVRLAAPPTEAAKWFDKIGLKTSTLDGKLRPIPEVFQELGTKLRRLPEVKRLEAIDAIFGKIPISSAAKLVTDLGSTNSEFMKLANTMSKTEITAASMAAIMRKGSVGAFAKFAGALADMAIAIAASGVLDAISSIAITMSKVFTWVSKANPAIMKLAVVITTLIGLAGPLLMFTGIALHGFGLIGTSLAAVGGIAGLVALPFVKLLGVVSLAAIGITTAVTNIDNTLGSVALSLVTLWNPIAGAITYVIARFDKLIPYFNLVRNALDTSLTGIEKGPGARALIWIGDKIGQVFDNLKNLVDWATFGGLKVIADALFTDEELTSAGLTAEGAIKGSALDRQSELSRNSMSQSVLMQKGNQENVTRVVFENAPPGTTAIAEKGQQEIDFMNGPIMPGLQ